MNKFVVLLAAAVIATPALADNAAPATPAQSNPCASSMKSAPASAPMAQKPAAAPMTQKPAAAPVGTVAKATFTTGIQNREPVDSVQTLTNDHNKIYFFTDLKGMAGQTITHRWTYNGKVMAAIPFKVGGNRWRVYSSKQLVPSWTGTWTVSVVNQAGDTLAQKSFTYTKVPTMPAAPAKAAPAASMPAAPASPASSNPCAPK